MRTGQAEMLAKVRERAREEQQQRHEEQKRLKILEEQQKQKHREKCITEAGYHQKLIDFDERSSCVQDET